MTGHSRQETVDMLLPGSHYLVKYVDTDELILHIKEDVVKDLKNLVLPTGVELVSDRKTYLEPELAQFLERPGDFRFRSIRDNGQREVFMDESKRYRNLGLYRHVLTLVKIKPVDKNRDLALQAIRLAISETAQLSDEVLEELERIESTEKVSQEYVRMRNYMPSSRRNYTNRGQYDYHQFSNQRMQARHNVLGVPIKHFHSRIFSYCCYLAHERSRKCRELMHEGKLHISTTPSTSSDCDRSLKQKLEDNYARIRAFANGLKEEPEEGQEKTDWPALYESFRYAHSPSIEMCHDGNDATLISRSIVNNDATEFEVKIFAWPEELEFEIAHADIHRTPQESEFYSNAFANQVGNVVAKTYTVKRSMQPQQLVKMVLDDIFPHLEKDITQGVFDALASEVTALRKNLNPPSALKKSQSPAEDVIQRLEKFHNSFVVKIAAQNEYILGDMPIGHHRYFHKCWNWHGLGNQAGQKDSIYLQSATPALIIKSIHYAITDQGNRPFDPFLTSKYTISDYRYKPPSPPRPLAQQKETALYSSMSLNPVILELVLEGLYKKVGFGKYLADQLPDDTHVVEIASIWIGDRLLAESAPVFNQTFCTHSDLNYQVLPGRVNGKGRRKQNRDSRQPTNAHKNAAYLPSDSSQAASSNYLCLHRLQNQEKVPYLDVAHYQSKESNCYLPERRISLHGFNHVPLGACLRLDYILLETGEVKKFGTIPLVDETVGTVQDGSKYIPIFTPSGSFEKYTVPATFSSSTPVLPPWDKRRHGCPTWWDIGAEQKYFLAITFIQRDLQTRVPSKIFVERNWPDFVQVIEEPPKRLSGKDHERITFRGDYAAIRQEINDELRHVGRDWTHEPPHRLKQEIYETFCGNRYLELKGVERYGIILLAKSINWRERQQVTQFYKVLKTWDWKNVPLYAILQILDSSTPVDPILRTYAVRKGLVNRLTHDNMLNIMLQLVVLLQCEPHMDNALTRWLLETALNTRKVAHFLYWHLTETLHVQMEAPHNQDGTGKPYSTLRIRLLLEALLRSIGPYRDEISQQCRLNRKLTGITRTLQLSPNFSAPSGRVQQSLRDLLEDPDTQEILNNLTSPLSPTQHLGRLNVDKCSMKNSAKCPIELRWDNGEKREVKILEEYEKWEKENWLTLPETKDRVYELVPRIPYQRTYSILFKLGDDLRHDMLTCQTIRVMDNLWQSRITLENKAPLVLYPVPYGCLSTGKLRGLIEIVPESITLGRIESNHGSQLKSLLNTKDHLYSYLTQVNLDRVRMNSTTSYSKQDSTIGSNAAESTAESAKAPPWAATVKILDNRTCEIFTRSLAAACTSTYVIGVRDRHTDNMMVKQNGQFFHIDFGHILNHKKRFGPVGTVRGIERVPFILTEGLLMVVFRGTEGPKGIRPMLHAYHKSLINESIVTEEDGKGMAMSQTSGSSSLKYSRAEAMTGPIAEQLEAQVGAGSASYYSDTPFMSYHDSSIIGSTPAYDYPLKNQTSQLILQSYHNWRTLTAEAFSTLRKHDQLLLTLFAILRNASLPELKPPFKSKDDEGLPYLIERLGRTRAQFEYEMDQALDLNMTTLATVDRAAGNLRRHGLPKGGVSETNATARRQAPEYVSQYAKVVNSS